MGECGSLCSVAELELGEHVADVGGVAEPAMAPIIASPAPGHHGPIGGWVPSSHDGLAALAHGEPACPFGQEPSPWRFLATTAIVRAYSSLGLNSTTMVPGSPTSPVWPGPT
jgi:hypothetical protein